MINIQDSWRNCRNYNGTTEKFGITLNGVDYIVKMPSDGNMSVICEYIASNFMQALGVNAHSVALAKYGTVFVAVLKDFTSGTNLTLHAYKDTKQSSEDTDIGTKEYTYEDVIYLIEKHVKLSESNKEVAKINFWDMFIMDTILGNRDRHWGNWGYLSDGKNYYPAPIYDNGACLFPDVNRAISGYINNRESFLYDRIFIFPASLFKVRRSDRCYRTNYYEMYSDLRINKLFASRVKRIRSLYSYKDIFRIISGIVFNIPIDNIYKRFYIEIVTLRYMCIIERRDFNKSLVLLEKEEKRS